jgi:pimeloyl-ACP methyl ester carboxylesterase
MTTIQQSDSPGTPVSFQANGLCINGLSWGQASAEPVLALHGWLDNAASFTRLAPLLDKHYVVALDLTGHGLTDRRSMDGSYQIWDDLPEIFSVCDQLGWDRFSLMGHSRGAIISTLFAAAFPERVHKLVMLDAVAPAPVEENKFPEQMRKALLERSTILSRHSRVYVTVEEAIKSRVRRGLSDFAAEVISRRNLRPCAGGFEWTTDPRLHGASQVKMSQGQIAAVLSRLSMPVLLMLAREQRHQGTGWMQGIAREHIPDITVKSVEGSHHFHMDDDVAEVAVMIQSFLGITE